MYESKQNFFQKYFPKREYEQTLIQVSWSSHRQKFKRQKPNSIYKKEIEQVF